MAFGAFLHDMDVSCTMKVSKTAWFVCGDVALDVHLALVQSFLINLHALHIHEVINLILELYICSQDAKTT